MEDIRGIETFKMEGMLFKALRMLPLDIKCYQIFNQIPPSDQARFYLKVLIRINCRSIEILIKIQVVRFYSLSVYLKVKNHDHFNDYFCCCVFFLIC